MRYFIGTAFVGVALALFLYVASSCASIDPKQSVGDVSTTQPVNIVQALAALTAKVDAQISANGNTGVKYTSYGGIGAFALLIIHALRSWGSAAAAKSRDDEHYEKSVEMDDKLDTLVAASESVQRRLASLEARATAPSQSPRREPSATSAPSDTERPSGPVGV